MALAKKADQDFSSKMLKAQEKSKADVKTIRFQLALGESNEKTCPELNYRELVESEQKKCAKKVAGAKEKDGTIPMDVEDEDREQMEAMARKFEEKYGGPPTKQKKRKKDKRNEDYVDLGAGYDDNDSFIDNTEVYDEIVPCEMTTAQGGFYINCGALEFKQVEQVAAPSSDDEEIKARKKKNSTGAICSDSSSDDDDDSDDEDDEDDDSDDSADGKGEAEQPKEAQPAQPAATNGVEKLSVKLSVEKSVEKTMSKNLEKQPALVKNIEKSFVKNVEKPAVKAVEKPVVKFSEKPVIKAVESAVISITKEPSSKSQVLKRPSPDSVPNDVPPSKKLSSSPEIIELEPKETKKPVKPIPQSSAISIETALKNVPELTVTMKPQQKVEVPKEKASSAMSNLLQQLKGALASVAYQNNSDKRLTNQEKSSPLEVPWSREISNLMEKYMDLLMTPEGRLDKVVVESKILPLWPNSWMYRDNLYLKLKSLLRKLISGTKQPMNAAIMSTAQTTITPIPSKHAKMPKSESNNSHSSSAHRMASDKSQSSSSSSRNHESKESREQKIMYSRNEHSAEDLLTQVIKERLPSPKASRPLPPKSEPSRQLKLVPQEDLRSSKLGSGLNLDSEASVQMEMRRVMQELVELNEKRSLFSAAVSSDPGAPGSSRMGASGSRHINPYPDPYQHFRNCDDKQAQMEMLSATMTQMAKAGNFRDAPPGFLNSTIGFQEEFRRHLTSARNPEPLFPPNLPTDFTKNWKF